MVEDGSLKELTISPLKALRVSQLLQIMIITGDENENYELLTFHTNAHEL